MLATKPPPAPAGSAKIVQGGGKRGGRDAPIMLFVAHFFSSCTIALPRKAGFTALWDACYSGFILERCPVCSDFLVNQRP